MEKRPTLRFLAGREDAGSTPDPQAAPNLFYYLFKNDKFQYGNN